MLTKILVFRYMASSRLVLSMILLQRHWIMRRMTSVYQPKRFLILEHWNIQHIILPHFHFISSLIFLEFILVSDVCSIKESRSTWRSERVGWKFSGTVWRQRRNRKKIYRQHKYNLKCTKCLVCRELNCSWWSKDVKWEISTALLQHYDIPKLWFEMTPTKSSSLSSGAFI
jgi:hypothetical protein